MTDSRQKKTTRKNTGNKLGHDPLAFMDAMDKQESSAEDIHDTKTVSQLDNENESVVGDADSAGEVIASLLDLPPYLGIAQAAEVYTSIQGLLNTVDDKIEINAGEVESVDTAGLQLLMALCKQSHEKGIQIQWQSVSPKLMKSAELLNIKHVLCIN